MTTLGVFFCKGKQKNKRFNVVKGKKKKKERCLEGRLRLEHNESLFFRAWHLLHVSVSISDWINALFMASFLALVVKGPSVNWRVSMFILSKCLTYVDSPTGICLFVCLFCFHTLQVNQHQFVVLTQKQMLLLRNP